MVDRETDRGQTAIDFALGASILLLGVAFVIVMAPNLFTPFAEGQSADPLTADRLADHLAEDRFADADSVDELDETFFDRPDDTVANDLQTAEFRDVNVTMVNMSDGSDTVERGPSLPETTGRTTQSQRVVVVDDEPYWLYVRVW